jgi:cholest-4-en-3-one 26-monooxygenase
MDIDLVDPDLYANGGIPHEQFRWLRENAPVYRHHGDPDFWAITRFDDVVHVSRHPEIFSSHTAGSRSSPNPRTNTWRCSG